MKTNVLLIVGLFLMGSQSAFGQNILESRQFKLDIQKETNGRTAIFTSVDGKADHLIGLGASFDVVDHFIDNDMLAIAYTICSQTMSTVKVRFYQYDPNADTWTNVFFDALALKDANGNNVCNTSKIHFESDYQMRVQLNDDEQHLYAYDLGDARRARIDKNGVTQGEPSALIPTAVVVKNGKVVSDRSRANQGIRYYRTDQ